MSYDSTSIFKAFEAILVLPIHTLFLYSKNTDFEVVAFE